MQDLVVSINNFGKGSEWFWAMLQFAVVTVTLVVIYVQIRLQSASHVVHALNAIHARWNEDAMLRARHAHCSAWLSGDREIDPVADYLCEFIEELGSYLKIGAIPAEILWDAHSWYIENYYFLLHDSLVARRESFNDRTLYQDFERLFEVMRAINVRRGAPSDAKSEEEQRQFAEGEVRVTQAFLRLKEQEPSIRYRTRPGSTHRAALVREARTRQSSR